MKKKARWRLAAALALIMLVCAGYLVHRAVQTRQSAQDYQNAEKFAGVPRRTSPPTPSAAPEETAPPDPWALALDETDLDALREVNPDVIGWICIPDTDLNYPLMFNGDNSYYLTHSWSGKRNAGGSIFLEKECSPDLSDFNTIIYGHRMTNTTMFGTLRFFADEAFWREHPSVYLVSDQWVYRCDIFAVYETDVRSLTYRLRVTEDADKREFLDYALESAAYETGIVPAPEDQVLTLSTCVDMGQSDYRWVVQAVFTSKMERQQS